VRIPRTDEKDLLSKLKYIPQFAAEQGLFNKGTEAKVLGWQSKEEKIDDIYDGVKTFSVADIPEMKLSIPVKICPSMTRKKGENSYNVPTEYPPSFSDKDINISIDGKDVGVIHPTISLETIKKEEKETPRKRGK
jgi:hypothetical protein